MVMGVMGMSCNMSDLRDRGHSQGLPLRAKAHADRPAEDVLVMDRPSVTWPANTLIHRLCASQRKISAWPAARPYLTFRDNGVALSRICPGLTHRMIELSSQMSYT